MCVLMFCSPRHTRGEYINPVDLVPFLFMFCSDITTNLTWADVEDPVSSGSGDICWRI